LEELVEDAVNNEFGDVALDLYAGVGLFSLQLAKRFNRVLAVDADQAAVELARANVVANDLVNVEFHRSAVESWIRELLKTSRIRVDLLLLDPPRGGASETLSGIIELGPSRITYVSCDPTTLARDLRVLLVSGYEISRITALDLFPQTYHVETVVALARTC